MSNGNLRGLSIVAGAILLVGYTFIVNDGEKKIAIEENSTLKIENAVLKVENRILKDSLQPSTFRIKVTGYHPGSGGINSDANSSMTATMTPHKAGRTCAISTELIEAGWLGKEIYVEGFGMVVANDRLAKGVKGKQIDLCKGSYSDAMAVGVNADVLASVVSRTNIKTIMED